ncbi:uncharacterized protein LOC109852221 [Pseudomyrmex gracilis]|uniref:uncharacterized protein LOC109852221 n=1 Tax=Pseudomyrmex gracilis TaxID=219809 RepID=UPI0009956192|nr:uncharacterized protein LOC109852221 [Pseudomyrmex gracilis]XP_020278766.1 uncharacterized protein LOC109852221 [Pseudomyrmex gracilis]XP_020278767.1 uncharacterized protein LOC109852221 [Pseudomyrmex gracilis]
MLKNRRDRLKLRLLYIGFLALYCITIFYNEVLVYEIQKWMWRTYECSDCVRILLVADPQILGERNENYFGSSVAIWDSDRYLEETFSRALRHSQPHVIAFLGDLMDEGHIATLDEFKKYKKRLDSIFSTPDNIMKIYIPGDNDIGGEEDSVSPGILQRFNFAYTQPDTLVYKSVTFFKVNRLTRTIPKAPKDAFLNDYKERNITNVILSHVPLLSMPDRFVQSVLEELTPQVIFTAHTHHAAHESLDTATDQLSYPGCIRPQQGMMLYELRVDVGDIHEVQIPTCSYRMGTPDTGYGLAYIDTQGKTVAFTILWQPGRIPQLYVYAVVGPVSILLALIIFKFNCFCYARSYVASNLPERYKAGLIRKDPLLDRCNLRVYKG